MSYPDKCILRKQELDAFIAQAFAPELMNSQYLQELTVITTKNSRLRSINNSTSFPAAVSDVTRRATGRALHAGRRDGSAGERRMRGPHPVVNVVPVALLRRETLPPHPSASGRRQKPPGIVREPHR